MDSDAGDDWHLKPKQDSDPVFSLMWEFFLCSEIGVVAH